MTPPLLPRPRTGQNLPSRPVRHVGRARRAGAVLLAGVTLVLAGCAAAVPMQPAADAANPDCAEIIVRLPESVADQPSRETNAQGTGAWGDPAAVLLTCGVPVPGPTTLPCVNINGVDWIEDDSEAPQYRYTTYGREPATEVYLDSEVVSGSTTLVDLAAAVSNIPATKACLGANDVQLPDNTP